MRSWVVRVALGTGAVLLTGCPDDAPFRCEDNGQCPDDGFCEVTGLCSVSDETCASGRRYAELSGDLAGECVPPDDATGSTDTSSPPSTSDASGSTSTAGTTSGSTQSSGEDTSAADSSSTSGPPQPQVFVDDDAVDFGSGSFVDTRYEDGLRLSPENTNGVFISRVFDAGQTVAWTEISWTPRAPYGKALPDGSSDESGYDVGNVSMADNVLLLHFDLQTGTVAGDALTDASGQAQLVTLEGSGTVAVTDPAVVDRGIALTPAHHVRVASSEDFQFGTDDFTWSVWARSSSDCRSIIGVNSNQVYMGIDSDATGGHAWLGCFNPTHDLCGNSLDGGRLGGTLTPDQDLELGGICADSGPELVDGAWHHLAVVKQGHASSTLQLWFDGEMVASSSVEYPQAFTFDDATPFELGRLDGGFAATVELDEASVFRRALEPAEIEDHYLRGVLGLELRVRACETASCNDATFVGADGEEGDIVDGASGPVATLEDLEGRYFQYRVSLSRPNPAVSREAVLDEVRVTATGM